MRPALLALALLACAFPRAHAQAPTGFAAVAASQIHEVARFDPPGFTLSQKREGAFSFYGEAMNRFEEVRCERSAAFGLVAKANVAGSIQAGVCEADAKRVRALAVRAQPALAGTIVLLRDGAISIDAAALDKLGWTYAKRTDAGGAEEHDFAVIVVGHGFATLHTLVRVPAGGRRAIVVQAETMRLCENYGLKEKTALCRDTRGALADIARRLEAAAR